MTKERMEEIRTRSEKATPGPWFTDGRTMVYTANPDDTECVEMRIADIRGWGYLTGKMELSFDEAVAEQEANTAFIAHARQDIPDLLDALEDVRNAIKGASACLSIMTDAKKEAEADRDRWKACANALEKALQSLALCESCVKFYSSGNHGEKQFSCETSKHGNCGGQHWQFDQEKFGGDKSEVSNN